MADFDLEQLKTLFENLGERLEKTKGDQLSRDELYRIRSVLTKMGSNADKATKAGKNAPLNPKDFATELVKEMKHQQGGRPSGAQPTGPGPKKTIIQQEIERRKTDTRGFTILDRELRGSANEVDALGDASKSATKDIQEAGKRAAASKAAWGTLAGAAGAMVSKMMSVGGERVDYYRDILASGEGSIDSMQDLGRQAVAAGVTVEQFAKAMKEGTDGARLLGGVRWLALNKSVVEMTKASGSMGMTVEQIQAASQDYSEILRLQGLSRDRTTEQMAQGMFQLVQSSEATANILGKTREEAMAAQKEQASNSNVQASIESQGLNDKQSNALNSFATTMANTYGEAGKTLVNDIIQYGQPVNKAATNLAAAMPELSSMVDQRVGAVKGDRAVEARASAYADARGIEGVSRNVRSDKARLGQMAVIGGLSDNGFADTATAFTAGTAAGRNLKTRADANAGTQQGRGSAERATNQGVLELDSVAQHFKVVADQVINTVFNPMVTEFGPKLTNTINPALNGFADGLIRAGQGLEGQTTTMAYLGATALTAAAAFTGVIGIMSAVGKAKNIAGLIRGGTAAAGAAQGAAGAGIGAFALPAAVAVGGAAVAYGGGKMVENRKNDESFFGTGKNDGGFIGSRSNGYATSALGGAATGAAIGSIIPGVGTVIGAGVGGLLGAGYAYMNDDSGNATQAPQNARAGSRAPQMSPRSTPANAATQRGKNSLSADQMTNKIMDANERSASLLKSIKETTDKQLEAMREDVAISRAVGDRLARLLEEGNKHTKAIADHTA